MPEYGVLFKVLTSLDGRSIAARRPLWTVITAYCIGWPDFCELRLGRRKDLNWKWSLPLTREQLGDNKKSFSLLWVKLFNKSAIVLFELKLPLKTQLKKKLNELNKKWIFYLDFTQIPLKWKGGSPEGFVRLLVVVPYMPWLENKNMLSVTVSVHELGYQSPEELRKQQAFLWRHVNYIKFFVCPDIACLVIWKLTILQWKSCVE
jgi:hypothetical protein